MIYYPESDSYLRDKVKAVLDLPSMQARNN